MYDELSWQFQAFLSCTSSEAGGMLNNRFKRAGGVNPFLNMLILGVAFLNHRSSSTKTKQLH